MPRPMSELIRFPYALEKRLKDKLEQTKWYERCGEYAFLLAKQFNVEPWQIGPMGFDPAPYLAPGIGWLRWTPFSWRTGAAQELPHDFSPIVVTKDGAEVTRKWASSFSQEDIVEYCTSTLLILPQPAVESRASWQFPQNDLTDLQQVLAKSAWRLSDQQAEALKQRPPFDGRSIAPPLRPAVAKAEFGKHCFLYLAMVPATDPDSTVKQTISPDEIYYIFDLHNEPIDSIPTSRLTLRSVEEYGSNHVWINARYFQPQERARLDMEMLTRGLNQ